LIEIDKSLEQSPPIAQENQVQIPKQENSLDEKHDTLEEKASVQLKFQIYEFLSEVSSNHLSNAIEILDKGFGLGLI
jgi:hypothetical protein